MAAKLRNTDTGPRDWWKTLKHFIKPNNTTSIPPLSKDGIVHTEEADKASLMNDFFVEQTILDESNATLPPNIDPPENNLNSISTSPHEVESILKSLQLGKASGPDEISYHILKQDQTLLWTCVAGACRCVNSRYAKFKYTGMKSDYIQISQCNLQ